MVSFSDIKFYKTTTGLGGSIDTTKEIKSSTQQNLFSGFSRDELIAGTTKYECFYVKNTSTETIQNIQMWISSGTPLDYSYIQFGFDAAANAYDGAVGFGGVDDYIDCGNDANLWSRSLSKFSFSVRIFPINGGDGFSRNVVSHGGTSNQSFRLIIDASDETEIHFTIKDSGGVLHTITSQLDQNVWNVITCSYDSTALTDNMRIYKDGVLQETQNLTVSINLSAILSLADSSNDYEGYMSDFKFWYGDAISTTEALELFNTGEINDQPADYHLTFEERTGSTTTDQTTHTKTATLQNGTFWKTNARTIPDETHEPQVIDQKWYVSGEIPDPIKDLKPGETFPVWVKIHAEDTTAQSYINDHGVFTLKFDISTSGTGTNSQEGFKSFNGTSEKLDVNDAAALDLNQFSVSARFRTTKNYRVSSDDPAGEEGMILIKGKWVGGSPYINYGMWVTDTNGLRGGFEESDGTDHLAKIFRSNPDEWTPGETVVNDGVWHLGTVTYDGSDVKLYLDGTLMDTRSTGGATPTTTSTPLRIGANNFEGFESTDGIHMYFKGDIDDVYVWNNDLTSGEITDLKNGEIPQEANIVYKNTFDKDDSGTPATPPTNADYKICFAGDWGCETETTKVVDLINKQGYDYIIGVGDNAYESADCWISRFKPLKDKMDSAFGNHEYSESGGISPYKNFFGYSSTHVSVRFQNMLILILDDNDFEDSSAPSLDSEKTWVKGELDKYKTDSKVTWRIVVSHHPPFGLGGKHPANEGGQVQKWHKMFTDYNVNFWYCGHDHNWQRTHSVSYNSASPKEPNIVDSSSPYTRLSGGLINIVTGTGGHDPAGGLYSLFSSASFWAYQNKSHNGVHELIASNNGNTLKGSFRDVGGSTFDTFTITA